MKKNNQICIKFILDFITISANNNDIENIFKTSKNKFIENSKEITNDLDFINHIILSKKIIDDLKIEYHKDINERRIYLYENIPRILNIYYDEDNCEDYSLDVYKLIEYLDLENYKIFYCDKTNKRFYLKISIEAMKFYHRHKTYEGFFSIDIKNGDKPYLKSIIRKFKPKIELDENDENSEEDEYEYGDSIQQKACLILIYNCNVKDLLDVNIYSILKNDCSFIILYDNEDVDIGIEEKEEISINNDEEIEEKELSYFFIKYDYGKIETIDNNFIASNIKGKDGKGGDDFDLNKLKNHMINYKSEAFPNGNLYQYLLNCTFKEGEVKIIFYKILKIVQILHWNKICSLDLDPSNIMLDKKYNPIFLNFGTAKKYGQKMNKSDMKLNEYSAPELYLENPNYDGFKSDIFSLGIILFVLLFGKQPFSMPLNKCKLYDYIKKGKFPDFWKIINKEKNLEVSEEFKTLFINMVSYDPNNRFNIQEIFNSSWLEKTNKIFNENSKELKEIESEINNKFNEIGKKDEVLFSKKVEENLLTRSYNEPLKVFVSEEPETKNPEIDFNNYIKIKGNINPAHLMNELWEKIIKNGGELYLDNVKGKLEFIVDDENNGENEEEQEEENEEVSKYSVRLYKDANDSENYYLNINYISGSLEKFYKGVKLVKSRIKEL